MGGSGCCSLSPRPQAAWARATARTRCAECFALATELGDRFFVATALEVLAGVMAVYGQVDAAVRLFGAAELVRDTIGAPMPPAFAVDYHASLAHARAQLTDAAFAAGRLLTPEQAMAGVVQAHQTTRAAGAQPPAPCNSPALPQPDMLTPREAEVLRLVATGCTDAQIAAQLCISTRTVHAHVRSIYGKLEVANRSAATRYALDHGLA
jgi:DNA-binding CsgD family transcriptional regulator